MEHEFAGPDGRVWRFIERLESRRDDDLAQVVVEVETPGERRVVTCRRWEWDHPTPDLRALLERSLPGGASRGMGGGESGAPPRDDVSGSPGPEADTW